MFNLLVCLQGERDHIYVNYSLIWTVGDVLFSFWTGLQGRHTSQSGGECRGWMLEGDIKWRSWGWTLQCHCLVRNCTAQWLFVQPLHWTAPNELKTSHQFYKCAPRCNAQRTGSCVYLSPGGLLEHKVHRKNATQKKKEEEKSKHADYWEGKCPLLQHDKKKKNWNPHTLKDTTTCIYFEVKMISCCEMMELDQIVCDFHERSCHAHNMFAVTLICGTISLKLTELKPFLCFK